MSLSEVSNVLWCERRLLELLVFKLDEEQFVLESGRTRWLAHADREVQTVLDEIKRVELECAMAVAGSARELGMSGAPSLRELAAVAPPPWNGIFDQHQQALSLLAREVEAATELNRDTIRRVQHVARDALATPAEIDIDVAEALGRQCDLMRERG